MNDINIADYDYDLPENRIAQFPWPERDGSKLLLFDGRDISSDIFRNIDKYIRPGSLLVFNNTRVIRARLVFRKKSGARIEIFCLEPLNPSGYDVSLTSHESVEWKCIIGNLKKWKSGSISMVFPWGGKDNILFAEKAGEVGEALRIRFYWHNSEISFSEVIEAAGKIPLPPYIAREAVMEDNDRYQTVYSKIKGSVAAPTAGLHFTEGVLEKLKEKGIERTDITLHVGAGTFQPVRSNSISGHSMHTEHFVVTADTISRLRKHAGKITAVGTTSVRTLESIYWLGVRARLDPEDDLRNISQWEPYGYKNEITTDEALMALEGYFEKNNLKTINASTGIIIVPGYRFRITNAIITNFHQPKSTLLLLIAAWTGDSWKRIYNYALNNGFRFLSYGDSSFMYIG
jgi:S-adenosylmethionine:tRNA ribosyltransferase-isomerase